MEVKTSAISVNIQDFPANVKAFNFTGLHCHGIKLIYIGSTGGNLGVVKALNPL